MIVTILATLVCVLGLWAAIATGIAVAKDTETKILHTAWDAAQGRIASLEDRQQASSLSEYHAARVAMPSYAREVEEKRYRYDDTGLIRELVPADDDDDVA